MKVAFYKHNIGEDEIDAVNSVLRSPMHTAGPITKDFENLFATYVDCRKSVGMTSWTMGAFLCLRAMKIGAGDEVIVPSLTFISSANVICHVGAKPVFVDVEKDTGLLDAELVKKAITPRTKLIMPVHMYGAMCDMNALHEISEKHNIPLMEDAAHCVEGEREGIRPGMLSKAVCYSFYATKNLACGDGGAVASNDESLAAQVAKLRFHGMSRGSEDRYSGLYKHYDMDELGYKCNLTDIQAAMLIQQLPKIEGYRKRKDEIALKYEQGLMGLPGVDLLHTPKGSRHARHIFVFLAPEGKRDLVLSKLQEYGIGVAVHFNPVHLMSYYRKNYGLKEGDFPNTENIGRRSVTLPLYAKLSDEEVEYVIKSLREILS